MKHHRIVGYLLFAAAIVWATSRDTAPTIFIDTRLMLCLAAGVAGLILVADNLRYGRGITMAIALSSALLSLIGNIHMAFVLKQPSELGPAMALTYLVCFYALIAMLAISFPREDDFNKLRSRTDAMARLLWFGFPIASLFFLALSFFFLLFAFGQISLDLGSMCGTARTPA